ncbi:hypothetical protein [Haliea sp.]|uniref:TapB family protein n=1 Tax=Haliea sp. TaxID=1932666 RepID=UPI0025C55643|nr:hypothetical protein [Haliea sp.]
MLTLRYLLVLLCTAVLGACKISISVPEGGSVTTRSGSLSCPGGETCVVNVVDLLFDETFVARPADGYRFEGWRKQHRGLCGGTTAPCRLFTSGFAGNDALMAFLASDEVFFLNPVFEAASGNDYGTQPLSACFSPDLFRQGTRFVSEYRRPGPGGGYFVAEFDQVIDGTGLFQGNPAIRMRLEQRSEGELLATNLTWFSINLGAQRLQYYGSEVETAQPPLTSATLTLAPFKLNRWDLAAGQSFQQNYSSTLQDSRGSSSSQTVELKTTYLGTETITVPAGTYTACRVLEESVETGGTGVPARSSETQWYALGTGILLRSESEDSYQEFLRGAINGVPQ